MDGIYEVTYRGQTVGTAEVTREGLYFRIFCRCRVNDSEIHRLYAGSEKIGVLIPEKGILTLQTRIPARKLKEGCDFSLDCNRKEFIPIRPKKHFSHLNQVRNGKLGFLDGEPGLYFTR